MTEFGRRELWTMNDYEAEINRRMDTVLSDGLRKMDAVIAELNDEMEHRYRKRLELPPIEGK